MNLEASMTKLLEEWLDGTLPESERQDLLRELTENAELRRRFADQVALMGATRAAADSNPRWLALFDLLEDETETEKWDASFEEITMGRIGSSQNAKWFRHPGTWGLAAALALMLAGSFLLRKPGAAVATSAPEPKDASPVAVVIGGSPENMHAAGTYLPPGVISQNRGWMTLQTFKGVAVTFDAPFEVELAAHDRMRLNQGRARVQVPDGAEGFRLESPAFDVVDLGTEFAAIVNADGTGTCRVFDGKADVSLLDSIGEVKSTQRLNASESVRIRPASQAIDRIEEKDSDYPELKMPPRPRLRLASSYAENMLKLAPLGYWRFETISDGVVPNELASGPRLQVAGTASITTEDGGNHSGDLTRRGQTEYFQIPNARSLLQGDFSISMFAQFDWLQNFSLVSAMRYDNEVQGHPFLLQSYAAFRRTAQKGTVLHAVFRDPPGWDGGTEVIGSIQLRPLHWHHIAVTRNAGLITLYLDGEAVARESVGTMPLDCRQIFVGRLNGNPSQSRVDSRGLVGRIDELAIFPQALSDAEILRLATP
jgi:hypothetical protein